MHPVPAQRFNSDLLPRIVERVQRLSRGTLHAEIQSPAASDLSACLRAWAESRPNGGRYAFPIDITLSWDSFEVGRLFASGGVERFDAYLNALPAKLDAWQEPPQIDFNSRTQAEATVLLGGLDFDIWCDERRVSVADGYRTVSRHVAVSSAPPGIHRNPCPWSMAFGRPSQGSTQ